MDLQRVVIRHNNDKSVDKSVDRKPIRDNIEVEEESLKYKYRRDRASQMETRYQDKVGMLTSERTAEGVSPFKRKMQDLQNCKENIKRLLSENQI